MCCSVLASRHLCLCAVYLYSFERTVEKYPEIVPKCEGFEVLKINYFEWEACSVTWNWCAVCVVVVQVAQLSQKDCATLYVVEYFAKSLNIAQGHSK